MDPFTHEKRKSMTPQRIAKIFALRGGRCGVYNQETDSWGQGCGWKFGVKGGYEIDHITALCRGGVDVDQDIRNFQLLCEACHSKKTGNDLKELGSMRRAYTRHVVPNKFRRSKTWRSRSWKT